MKLLLTAGLMLLLLSCSQGADSPRGFSLPEGNPAKGELVFRKYQCLACHSLKGFEDDSTEKQLPTPVRLGGNVSQIKTYAELVTSVINPSHKIAQHYVPSMVSDDQGHSKMRNYNDLMTVSELVDLVAFLQPQYQLVPYRRTDYPTFLP
ncbi:hypothetical protein GCM10009092_43910 [Bowmanella denitrificans]|uniref:Cytochrome c domain-containing protein n=1 Tax=Bowmanella denitrificans TaxID=366582 RepID=A0ABP3HQI2_9ALTE